MTTERDLSAALSLRAVVLWASFAVLGLRLGQRAGRVGTSTSTAIIEAPLS